VTATPTALPKIGSDPAPLAKASAPILPQPIPTTPPAPSGKPNTPIATPQPSRDTKSAPIVAAPVAKPTIVQGPIGKPAVCDCKPIIPVQPRLVPLPGGTVAGRNSCNPCCQPSCNTCCQPSCNNCCQSSCVCCTPSPLRQSWLGRLFKPNPPCDAVVCKPAPTSPAAAAKPTAPATAVAKAATEPPQPRDWRESWGKIEPWKGAPQADSAKRTDTPASKPVDAPTRPVARKPAQLDPPKQPDPLKDPSWYGEMALKQKPTNSKIPEEMPKQKPTSSKVAEETPKQRPANNKVAEETLKQNPANSKVAEETPKPVPPAPDKATVAQSTPRPLPSFPPPQTPATPTPVPAAQPTPPAPPVPPAEMVAISPTQPHGRIVQVPADEPNAFAPPAPPTPPPGAEQQPKINAFDRDDGSPPPRGGVPAMAGAPQGPMPMGGPMMGPIARSGPAMGPMPMPMPPRPPMPPPMADSGVPSGMSNAFTLTSTRRPIPADFGGTPQEPNGFGDAAPHMEGPGAPPQPYVLPRSGMMPPQYPGMQGTPGYPRPLVAVNPLMSVPPVRIASSKPVTPAASASGAPQLLATLKESMYPSQREWAAEQLSELNWHMQPQVVESLSKGAQDDPAATVRAACVRALGHMKVNTQEVVALVQDLKNDRDPRVRQEAGETLNALGVAPRPDSDVQQASHK
jgi:hypothetical protein